MIIQIGLYMGILAYLVADLCILSGPLSRLLAPAGSGISQAAEGVVARVHGQPITDEQLDHELGVYAFRRGLKLNELSQERIKQLRTIVLYRLIDDHLLRIKVRFNSSELKIDEEQWEAEWKAWKSRFTSEIELESSLAAHGLSREEMRYRLAAKQQQEAWLQRWLNGQEGISADQVRQFYEENKQRFMVPEQRNLRHIFAASLDHPGEQASDLIDTWTEKLRAGKESWEIAAQKSEDLSTAKNAGNLGWVSKQRLPEKFANKVFSLKKGQSTKVVSDLGVHWVEVLGVKKAHIQPFDKAKKGIRNALEARWRQDTLKHLREQMRSEALEAEHVLIFEHGGIGK